MNEQTNARHDDYQRRATMHRPTNADGLRAAAIDLQRSGLRIADIAHVLQLGEHAVEQLLGEHEKRS